MGYGERSGFGDRIRVFSPSLVVCIPVGLLSIYAKWALLDQQGERIVARQLGRAGSQLGTAEYLSFFANDVIVALVLLPLVLQFATRRSSGPAAAVARTSLAMVLCLVMFSQLHAFYLVGTYLSYQSFLSAFRFVLADPQQFPQYIGAAASAKLAAVLALTAASGFLSRGAGRTVRPPSGGPPTIYVAALPLLVLSTAVWRPQNVYYRASVLTACNALIGTQEKTLSEISSLSDADLIATYRRLAVVGEAEPEAGPWGTERGSDVIFFVMETTPAAVCRLPGAFRDLPTLRSLSERSFVGTHHYSTYPYTNRAVTSIFSGWYPSALRSTVLSRDPSRLLPGIPRILSASGYIARSYAPGADNFEDDSVLYRALGFEELVDLRANAGPNPALFEQRKACDRATLDRVKSDIRDFVAAGKRYVIDFHPQIGHGPWPASPSGDPFDAGRELVKLQDRWLGEIVDELSKLGRLDHTIIVVTGDHGLRTRVEYPALNGGRIEDVSFHVPLMVFAPNTVQHRSLIDDRTSHVDLKPSILNLLGIDRDRRSEQGLPVWDRRIADRTVFLFADNYLGADGFIGPAGAAMMSSVTEQVFTSGPELEFQDSDELSGDTVEARAVARRLTVVKSLVATWSDRFSVSSR